MAYKYPNLAAEMARTSTDYGVLYADVAKKLGKSSDTISNWVTGKAGELPTKAAFVIRDEYFPTMSIDYLFSEIPIVDPSGAAAQAVVEQ